MAAPKPSVSGLCWSWVVEALASSPEVDASVLHDLVQGTPNLYDSLGREAKDRVDLRCLEGICEPVKELKSINAPPSHQSRFDASESMENILLQIKQEIPLSTLREGIRQEVANDLYPVIKHKKANLPKVALEQLKDNIQEGYDPLSDSIEKCEQTAATNGKDSEFPSSKIKTEKVQESTKIRKDKDSSHSERVVQHVGEGSHSGSLGSSKRCKTHSETKAHTGDSPIGEESSESQSKKKLKRDLNKIVAKTENLEDAQEQSPLHIGADNAYEKGILHTDNELSNLTPKKQVRRAKRNSSASLLSGCSSEQFIDDQTCAPTNDGNVQEVEFRDGTDHVPDTGNDKDVDANIDARSAQTTSMDGNHVKIVGGENLKNNDLIQLEQVAERSHGNEDGNDAAEEGNDDSKKDTNADMDDNADAVLTGTTFVKEGLIKTVGPESHKGNELVQLEKELERSCENEDGDHAAEEGNDMEVDHNKPHQEISVDSEWADRKLCIKCNKDDDVLICSSCPIVVHEWCLGLSASSKNKTFCCPFCTLSNAVAKFDLTRRELSMFICGTPELEAHAQGVAEHVLPTPHIEDIGNNSGTGHGDTASGDKHKDDNSGFVDADVTSSKMKNTSLNNSSLDPRIKETEIEKLAEYHTEKGSNEKQKQKQVEDHPDMGIHDERIAFAGKTHAEEEMSQETREHQHHDQPKDASSYTSLSEEISENDNKKSANSKYSLRHVKRETSSNHPATPPGKRNRHVWTAEEEEALKEGVQRFASAHAQGMPWKTILEFGRSVFSRHRTPIHLKDKWRNMIKADPSLKRLMGV